MPGQKKKKCRALSAFFKNMPVVAVPDIIAREQIRGEPCPDLPPGATATKLGDGPWVIHPPPGGFCE